MKTKLPKEILTIQQAKSFLFHLFNNAEAYHPEDDAFDVLWLNCPEPSEQEKIQLNKLMDDIYALPGNNSAKDMAFDPCGYLIDIGALANFYNPEFN